ncbi:MAG: RNA polymerase sigma factor [Gaiellaceae bacterium]
MTLLEQSDASLVARCRAGEPDAWRLLVERYSRYVYAICSQGFRIVDEEAEDVFQEVFARAYEHLDRLRDDDAIRPWLAQTTRRLCIDHVRGRRHETVGEFEETAELDEVLESLDEALLVREALELLSPECREILDRFFARDQSYRTISEELELASGTVASRISRCLGRLRDELATFSSELGRNVSESSSSRYEQHES